MKKGQQERQLPYLPARIAEFVKLVARRMRYRKKVRREVMSELADHFEDALKDSKTDEDKEQAAQQLIEQFGDAKLLGVLLRRAKRRCRPLWRTVVARTFQTIGVIILCFVGYCVYISLGKPTIRLNYVEEATRMARTVADENLNAAPLYRKAIEAYKEPPQVKIEKKYVTNGRERGEKITETKEVSLLDAIRNEDWIGDLSEAKLVAVEKWITDNAEAAEFFTQASQKPHCWWEREAKSDLILEVLMPELSRMNKLAKMTTWRAKLKAHKGDVRGAFDDLAGCYRVGRHLKGPRSLIEQLVGIAIQSLSVRNAFTILSTCQVESKLLEEFQEEFEKLVCEDSHIISFEVERFLGLDFIQRCYTDNGRGSGHMIPGRVAKYIIPIQGDDHEIQVNDYILGLGMSLASADREDMTRVFENVYSTGERWVRKTPWELREEGVDPELGMDKWSRFKRARYWPVDVLRPALVKISHLSHRAKSESEALICVIAIQRFARQAGSYPEDLEQLRKAGLLRTLPMDPYSDKPLVYRKVGERFTLYSLGENFEDDGGEVFRDDKGKVKLWADEGDAVFWPVADLEGPQAQEKGEEK